MVAGEREREREGERERDYRTHRWRAYENVLFLKFFLNPGAVLPDELSEEPEFADEFPSRGARLRRRGARVGEMALPSEGIIQKSERPDG